MSCSVIVEPPCTCLARRSVHAARATPRGPPQVVVEAPVLDGDDRPWKILAEALEAHGLAALFHPELSDLVPVGVVNVGVLHQVGVRAVEALPYSRITRKYEPTSTVRATTIRIRARLKRNRSVLRTRPRRRFLEAFLLVSKKLFTISRLAVYLTSTPAGPQYAQRGVRMLACQSLRRARRVGDLESRTEEYEMSYVERRAAARAASKVPGRQGLRDQRRS